MRRPGLLLLSLVALLSSCTKDENNTYYSTTQEFISRGQWSVDYYYAGGDKTPTLSPYHFVFLGNGTLSGSDGNQEFAGSWKVLRDVNYNDVLQITLESQDPALSQLNEHWQVTTKDNSLISMKVGVNELRLKKK